MTKEDDNLYLTRERERERDGTRQKTSESRVTELPFLHNHANEKSKEVKESHAGRDGPLR